MRPIPIALLAAVAMSVGSARPAQAAGRRLAQTPSDQPAEPSEARRVVITEGNARTSRLVSELEQELKASSYVVVRVPRLAFEPESMLRALDEASAARGILVSDDGNSVVVFAASRGRTRLRIYGEYSVDRDNRLARRRQWISLVERLRVSDDESPDEEAADPSLADAEGASRETALAGNAPPFPRPVPAPPQPPVFSQHRLGATVALGYVTRSSGLTSHLLLMGHYRLTPRISLAGHLFWPMVQGERVWPDGSRSRAWTFLGTAGLAADLGRPSWPVSPYLGLSVGMQFLLAYVDQSEQPIANVYRIGSLVCDAQLGFLIALRERTWLLVHGSAGRITSLSPTSEEIIDSLADAWALRAAVGLLMAL